MKPDVILPWAIVIAVFFFILGVTLGTAGQKSIFELITELGRAALFLPASVGAYVAWKGVRQWKDELHGTSKYTAARELWRSSLSLRDALTTARHPVNLKYEIDIADSIENVGIQLRDDINNSQKYELISKSYYKAWRPRLAPVAEAMEEVKAKSIDVEMLFGAEGKALCDDMLKCGSKYAVAVETRIYNVRVHGADVEFPQDQKTILSWTPDADGWKDDSDEFSRKLESQINEIKTFAQKYVG